MSEIKFVDSPIGGTPHPDDPKLIYLSTVIESGNEHLGSISGYMRPEVIALIKASSEMLAALKLGRHAIGDHCAPGDCYATGPMTGDPIQDLVVCPACAFIAAYDAAIPKETGVAP